MLLLSILPVLFNNWSAAKGHMRQLVYNRNQHGGLWVLFVIKLVFEYERALVRPGLLSPFTHLGPPVPRFNLIGPASTSTFGFQPVGKCPCGAEHRQASMTCLPSLPPLPLLQLWTLNPESCTLRLVSHMHPLFTPAFTTTLLHLC